MGSLLDRRAALARKLVELDDCDLDALEPVVEAVRCQARVRALFTSGAQVPPGLLAVAVAEQPADDEPAVTAQRCTTCGWIGVMGKDWRCGCNLPPDAYDVVAVRRPRSIRSHCCATCLHVIVDGMCACTEPVEAARAAELVAHELDFEAVTSLAVAEAIRDLPDAGLADEIGGGACCVVIAGADDLRPGDRVEVTEAVGSRTGPRYAIGRFVGWERNERTGERMQLVEVRGVVGRYAAVRRVGS